MSIEALPLGQGSMLIPNTIAVMRGAPHPNEAQRLFDYLQSEHVRALLIAASALEGHAMTNGVGLTVNWQHLLAEMEEATATLREVFLR